jgi:hypothetical protein
MGYSSERWFRNQFGFLRRQFLQDGELPFTNVLCEQSIAPGNCADLANLLRSFDRRAEADFLRDR